LKIKNVLFIGLGGAGQRHLRILKDILPKETSFSTFRKTAKTPLLNSDFTVNNHKDLIDTYSLKVFNSIESAFDSNPDLTVISTPTSLHRESIMLALKSGSAIIVEKPWGESLFNFDLFKQEILKKELPFLISFQRRYHPLISKTNDLIKSGKIGKPMVAIFTVFSDVTTWHTYEDWKNLYAVRKDLGGGVLLTEIHEIDLVYWFFGLPKSVYCIGGNRGADKLDVEDTVQLSLIYDNFSVQLTICFVHKNKIRQYYIAGTDGSLSWDEKSNKLLYTNFKGITEEHIQPSDFTNDSMFISQAKHFINNWEILDTQNSILSAGCSLAIVESASKSIKSKKVEEIDQSFGVL
jgi:predicted dehydrogenase